MVLDHTVLSLTSHSMLVQCRIDTSWVNSSKNCAFFFYRVAVFNSVHWFTKRFRQMMTCLTYLGVNRLQPCLGLAFTFFFFLFFSPPLFIHETATVFFPPLFLLPCLRLCPLQHILNDFCNCYGIIKLFTDGIVRQNMAV